MESPELLQRDRRRGGLEHLVVPGEAGIGLVDGAVLDADAAGGHLVELVGGLLEEVAREVFGRGVQGGKRLEVVDHVVVEIIDGGTEDVLELLEIEQEAGFVELLPGQGDEDPVVVAVGVLALAVVVAEIVA